MVFSFSLYLIDLSQRKDQAKALKLYEKAYDLGKFWAMICF